MYPDRVGRLVIDGVYDAYNYRASLWNSNLHDTDAVVDSFFKFCFEAGSAKCPIHAASTADIRKRFEGALAQLEAEPVPISSLSQQPTLIMKEDLVSMMFAATYKPLASFPDVAKAVAAIETSNATALAELLPKLRPPYACHCSPPNPWETDNEAFNAIACGDGDKISYNATAYKEYYTDLAKSSAFAAQVWGIHYLQCAEWTVRPKWRYTGPLEAKNTSHPLLVVSPAFDPVCPLTDARKVAARYTSAGLLVQNSHGHCSLSAPSLCTARHVRAYFEHGTLPAAGSVCEPDELPFVGLRRAAGGVGVLAQEDRELLDAMRSVGEALPMLGGR